MESKKTYFIGDIHLGAPYIDDPKAHERKIVSWLDSIAGSARTLYILGDALDYWYEYRYVVPKGNIRFFGALARLADAGVKIKWIKGNHDIWIFGYLQQELGIEVFDHRVVDTIDGKRFYIAHGDIDGEPRPSYRRMLRLFRSPLAQRLFSAIHPGLTVPFARRWSAHSRMHGAEAGEILQTEDPLVRFAENYNSHNALVDYFVFGHRHILASLPVPPSSQLFVIGDAFRLFTYGEYDGTAFQIKEINTDI
ncbi:MAG: UDP-2,3-diacylglucosamine diphosphatase [Paramuribaculum sp.]|nr:UDP-2,3-diacylglucosamine diphosphatase [Paramuribaculum sp.]